MSTAATASAGREFDLPNALGKPSGEKITVRHVFSNEFRTAKSVYLSKLKNELADERDEMKRAALVIAAQVDTLSYIVAGWTLEKECTPQTVKQLLQDEPYLIDWLDEISTKSELFFGDASTS